MCVDKLVGVVDAATAAAAVFRVYVEEGVLNYKERKFASNANNALNRFGFISVHPSHFAALKSQDSLICAPPVQRHTHTI